MITFFEIIGAFALVMLTVVAFFALFTAAIWAVEWICEKLFYG